MTVIRCHAPRAGSQQSAPELLNRVFLFGQSRPRRTKIGYSRYDPAIQGRAAWNAGKAVGTKRPLTQKQIWAIRFFLDWEGCLRDRALFDLAIDSKLRGCDLVKIKIGDVVAGADVRTRAIVVQQKTCRPLRFELTPDVRSSLLAWLAAGVPTKSRTLLRKADRVTVRRGDRVRRAQIRQLAEGYSFRSLACLLFSWCRRVPRLAF